MNEPLKISAKNLGQTALDDFCPRCYWIKIKLSHKMPFGVFPGIFSSIDGFTKSCVHHIIDNHNATNGETPLPNWLLEIGAVVGYDTVPHYSKSAYRDEKSGITLTGAADDILILADGSKVLPDYKTSRFTNNQDKLMPMYEVQLITYGVLYNLPNAPLYCVYMEPMTEKDKAKECIIDCGFNMGFSAKVIPVEHDRKKVRNALAKTREIFELTSPPESIGGCFDCAALGKIIELLK
jgi:hypothetical protein